MARDYTPREMRLVAEWVAQEYPEDSYATRVRLGVAHPEALADVQDDAERRLIEGAFRRWADAIVYRADKLVLIEGKIIAHPVAISQLALYRRLIPSTPELRPWWKLPVEQVLLCAVEDPVITQLASEAGIRVAVYKPEWVSAYLQELRRRDVQPSRSPVPVAVAGDAAAV